MRDRLRDDQLLYLNKQTREYVGARGVIDVRLIHLFLQPFISSLEPKLHTLRRPFPNIHYCSLLACYRYPSLWISPRRSRAL